MSFEISSQTHHLFVSQEPIRCVECSNRKRPGTYLLFQMIAEMIKKGFMCTDKCTKLLKLAKFLLNTVRSGKLWCV